MYLAYISIYGCVLNSMHHLLKATSTHSRLLRGSGNPMRSVEVSNLKRGHAKDCRNRGYRQRSARPWAEDDLLAVMAHQGARIAAASGMQQLLLYRDALLLSILWPTRACGANAGSFRLANVRLPTGKGIAVGEGPLMHELI